MTDSTSLRLGDQVTLHYRLSCRDEILVDTFTEGPETFTLGQGEIDPRLESLMLDLRVGDHRLFELPPGEAFGPHDPAMIHTLPRGDFDANLGANLGAGMELAVHNSVDFTLPNGQTVSGTVLAIEAEEVRVDFNHPLAGLPVNFEVQILAIEPK